MPTLTRRRDKDPESWRIFYGDIEIGWVGERAGVPVDVEQWGWHCGFFPLSHRGVRADDHGATSSHASANKAGPYSLRQLGPWSPHWLRLEPSKCLRSLLGSLRAVFWFVPPDHSPPMKPGPTAAGSWELADLCAVIRIRQPEGSRHGSPFVNSRL